MTTRKPKPNLLYAIEPPTQWLQVVTSVADQDPAALCISALQRDGIDELTDSIASRLALDVRRVTLSFDADDGADRERIARVYRHAKVVQHEARDGRVVIVADVPRRLLGWLDGRSI